MINLGEDQAWHGDPYKSLSAKNPQTKQITDKSDSFRKVFQQINSEERKRLLELEQLNDQLKASITEKDKLIQKQKKDVGQSTMKIKQ